MSGKQPQQLAAIRIGYACYLVPAKSAAKVIELLSQAVECDDDFGISSERVYTITRPIVLEYRLVRASQVRRAAGDVDDEPVTVHGRLTKRAGVQGLLPMPRSKL